MDYLKILHENPDLADEFDSLFDFFLLDELSPRNDAEGRCTFSLLVSCICWHDCCDAKQYVDSKTLEEYGQRQRNCNLEEMDVDSLRRVSDALGIPTGEPLAPVLERFRKATQREPVYLCIFHEDDGSLTESFGLMFE